MDPDDEVLITVCPNCSHAINQHDADGCHQYIGGEGPGSTCECLWTPNTIAFWYAREAKEMEMEMTDTHMMTTEKIRDCPACGKELTLQVYWKVTLPPGTPITEGEVAAILKAAGVRIAHDCIPKATR